MGEHDVARFDDEGDVGRVAEFGADDLACRGNSVAQPGDRDLVSLFQQASPGHLYPCIAPSDAFDGCVAAELGFHRSDGLARGCRHAKASADQCREGMSLIRIEVEIGTTEPCQGEARLLAQVNPQQPGRDLTGEQHDGDEAEDVGQRVRGRDIGLKCLCRRRRETQSADRLARGTHHGGLGRGSRQQSACRAHIQLEQPRGEECHGDNQHDLDDDQQAPGPGGAVDAGEELWRDGEAKGVDEQREHEPLQAGIDLHADLADHQRGKQRAGNAAQLKRSQFDGTNRIADDQCGKDRELRPGG